MDNLPIQPGTLIAGKYRVAELVGEGGMGAVVRAHHTILDQQVAIKLMRPELMASPEAQSRFLREARAAARITSDYVARVNDVELLDDGTPCMVMEFMEGRPLEDALHAEEPLAVAWVVDRVLEALAGLAAAHALGIVHRDLKPGNIFLCAQGGDHERAKIMDFGLAKILEKEVEQMRQNVGQLTTSSSLIGSPSYMSPEQIMDPTDVDARADIWAMGCIMHELLTGELAFDSDQLSALMLSILGNPAPRVGRSDVPKGLAFVIGKCLSKDRRERFATAAELMRALAPYASPRTRGSLLLADDASFDDEHELAATMAAISADEEDLWLQVDRAHSTQPPAPTTPAPDAEVPAVVMPEPVAVPTNLDPPRVMAMPPPRSLGWGATLAVTLVTALVIAVTGWLILGAPLMGSQARPALQAIN